MTSLELRAKIRQFAKLIVKKTQKEENSQAKRGGCLNRCNILIRIIVNPPLFAGKIPCRFI